MFKASFRIALENFACRVATIEFTVGQLKLDHQQTQVVARSTGSPTAKRLRPGAQGCRASRLPWEMNNDLQTPTGLRPIPDWPAILATLTQPHWGGT